MLGNGMYGHIPSGSSIAVEVILYILLAVAVVSVFHAWFKKPDASPRRKRVQEYIESDDTRLGT